MTLDIAEIASLTTNVAMAGSVAHMVDSGDEVFEMLVAIASLVSSR
ncbi:hypothetical protein [Stakelama marina]|uniref:Uncharacterized protein n=1 Tax=Stakelama marina TaxID=2826939 RepID=A0A8T4IE61_9SPHN|nr:hypothetical protein [Stakelama marina]MBR0552833.1 hypothetical protein [Stakelama marina]